MDRTPSISWITDKLGKRKALSFQPLLPLTGCGLVVEFQPTTRSLIFMPIPLMTGGGQLAVYPAMRVRTADVCDTG